MAQLATERGFMEVISSRGRWTLVATLREPGPCTGSAARLAGGLFRRPARPPVPAFGFLGRDVTPGKACRTREERTVVLPLARGRGRAMGAAGTAPLSQASASLGSGAAWLSGAALLGPGLAEPLWAALFRRALSGGGLTRSWLSAGIAGQASGTLYWAGRAICGARDV